MNRAVALLLSVGGFLSLLALALLWAIPHMEDDLTDRATAGLAARGVVGNEVAFDGRNGTVSGPGAAVATIAIEDLRGARSIEAMQTAMVESAANVGTPSPSTTVASATTTPPVENSSSSPTTDAADSVTLDIARAGQSVVLSGVVGTEADRERLVNEATTTGYLVDDRLVVDGSVDASGRMSRAASGLIMAVFVGSDDGTIRVSDGKVAVFATAKDPVEAEAIEAAIEVSRSKGVEIESVLSVLDLSEEAQVVALQSEIDQIFELSRIIGQEAPGFGYSSEELNRSAVSILDRVIVAMRRYPKPAAEIEGHTDSDGSSAFNQELSVARAQTVVDYLAAGGVDADRLTVSGKGETEPVADNATEIGRLENRRVNFIVGKRVS